MDWFNFHKKWSRAIRKAEREALKKKESAKRTKKDKAKSDK